GAAAHRGNAALPPPPRAVPTGTPTAPEWATHSPGYAFPPFPGAPAITGLTTPASGCTRGARGGAGPHPVPPCLARRQSFAATRRVEAGPTLPPQLEPRTAVII